LALDSGYMILMDAGFYQGRKKEFNDFNRTWLFNPQEIDCTVLSHAHIDHCGQIPKWVKNGFKGKLPRIPVYVDNPMATNATDIFKLHPECFDDDIMNYMHTDPNPFGFANLKYIRKVEDSKNLNTSKEPAIIISASGMITAGRIRHHVFHNIEDRNTTILIVGYCATGTLGAILRNGAKRLQVQRVSRTIYKMQAPFRLMSRLSGTVILN